MSAPRPSGHRHLSVALLLVVPVLLVAVLLRLAVQRVGTQHEVRRVVGERSRLEVDTPPGPSRARAPPWGAVRGECVLLEPVQHTPQSKDGGEPAPDVEAPECHVQPEAVAEVPRREPWVLPEPEDVAVAEQV